jgi:hypothetical protein
MLPSVITACGLFHPTPLAVRFLLLPASRSVLQPTPVVCAACPAPSLVPPCSSRQALLALGDVCGKLTGLQWSYAKLSGPSSTSLLAACTSLTSLKLRLW